MDSAKFKAQLEALENGKELYEFFINAVETEKQRGISEVRERNKEAEGLRKFKIAFEKLGFNKDDSLDDYIENLKKSAEKAKDADSAKLTLESVNSELSNLRKKFELTANELASEKKAKEAIALENKRKSLKLKLTDALKDKVYGHDFVADSLINDGKVDIDKDEVYFKEGENKVAFNDGILKLLEERQDIIKNVQRGGAGSNPTTKDTGKKYTFEQIEKMSKDDIKANMADIKASLGITV